MRDEALILRECSLDGCDRPFYARGWCQPHYRCWQRNGDPLHRQRVNAGPPSKRERALFLRELLRCGEVTKSAEKAGRRTQTFYTLRERDTGFRAAWDKTLEGKGTEFRVAARRESWRRHKAKVRAAIAKFPSEENYWLWLSIRDPFVRWWLERYQLSEIRAMGSVLDFIDGDRSRFATQRNPAHLVKRDREQVAA